MEAAVRLSVPVGMVRFKDRPSTYAPFIKLTYQLRPTGWATLAREQIPLSSGVKRNGAVLFPSDFSESKRACEVAVVGASLIGRRGAVRVTVGPLLLEADALEDLGPIAIGGDKAGFTHEAARLPFPALPLSIVVEGAGQTLRCAIPGPGPEMALVIGGVWAAPRPIHTVIDTVLIDPERAECIVIHRGFFQHPGNVDGTTCLVVEPSGKLADVEHEVGWWPRQTVQRPRPVADEERTVQIALPAAKPPAPSLDEDEEPEPITERPRAAQSADPENSDGGDSEERITERPPPPQPEAGMTMLNMDSVDMSVDPLPFLQGHASTPTAAARPRDPEEHTAQFQLPRAPSAALPFTNEPTTLPSSSSRDEDAPRRSGDTMPPLGLASAPSDEMQWAPPLRRMGDPESTADLRLGQRPPEPRPTPGAAKRQGPDLGLDDYVKVRVELWAAARPRAEILKAHGLSELKWRVVQRKWSKEIDAMASEPEKLVPVLSRFQTAALS